MPLLRVTHKQALERGLVHCKSCGYPENNHFRRVSRLCAFSKECKGYKPKYVFPVVKEKRKR